MKICTTLAAIVILLLGSRIGYRIVAADPQIAFMGDSLTEGWRYPSVNFGVHGNTTAQMVARFPSLVADRRYKFVVILGGTNDILLGIDNKESIQNLDRLGQLAIQRHAEPVLCEIPPIFQRPGQGDGKDYMLEVVSLNRQIAQLSYLRHWRLVDYYSPLIDHPAYFGDGVHVKRRGYLEMEVALLRRLPLSSI